MGGRCDRHHAEFIRIHYDNGIKNDWSFPKQLGEPLQQLSQRNDEKDFGESHSGLADLTQSN